LRSSITSVWGAALVEFEDEELEEVDDELETIDTLELDD